MWHTWYILLEIIKSQTIAFQCQHSKRHANWILCSISIKQSDCNHIINYHWHRHQFGISETSEPHNIDKNRNLKREIRICFAIVPMDLNGTDWQTKRKRRNDNNNKKTIQFRVHTHERSRGKSPIAYVCINEMWITTFWYLSICQLTCKMNNGWDRNDWN